MTTTDARQVRMMFSELLSRYGIDNLQLEIDCCTVAKNYFEFRLKSNNKSAAKDNALDRQGQTKLRVADTWKAIMKMDYVPWEGRASSKGKENKRNEWVSFLNWLTEKEEQGKSVAVFCDWFVSDAFRMKTIAMWTPDGRKTDGAYSFKAVYLQAFVEKEAAPVPDEGGGMYV